MCVCVCVYISKFKYILIVNNNNILTHSSQIIFTNIQIAV